MESKKKRGGKRCGGEKEKEMTQIWARGSEWGKSKDPHSVRTQKKEGNSPFRAAKKRCP